jgi:hypothetical protein
MAKKSTAEKSTSRANETRTTETRTSETIPLNSFTSNQPVTQPVTQSAEEVEIYSGNSPLNFVPNAPNIGLWQIASQVGNSVKVVGNVAEYDYFGSFTITWLGAGQTTLTLNGFECPGDTPDQVITVTLNAMARSMITVVTSTGSYNVQIASVDPATPVSFQRDRQTFDSNRKTESFLMSGETERFPGIEKVVTNPTSSTPTQWAQNPIKISVLQITSDQGEYTGNSAVLYGYYLKPYGQELQFYLDVGQSTQNFNSGQCGVKISIDEVHSTIVVG